MSLYGITCRAFESWKSSMISRFVRWAKDYLNIDVNEIKIAIEIAKQYIFVGYTSAVDRESPPIFSLKTLYRQKNGGLSDMCDV